MSDSKAHYRKQYMCLEFPYVYTISLGRLTCTRRCRMCPMFNQAPSSHEFISDEVMEAALAAVGDREVSLEISAFGEPFLHPRCDDYLDLARRMAPNAQIVFVTNGSTIDETRAERIVASGIDVLQFSLVAGSRETYQWLTGSEEYDQVCHNLKRLAEIRDHRGASHLKIQTHIMGLKELEHEFEAFVNKWSAIVDQAVVRDYGNWGGRVDTNDITPMKETALPPERYPCAWLWYATKIEPDGKVVKCHQHVTGHDCVEFLGNILEEDFTDIWKGKKMQRARELHLNCHYDELEFCGDCQVWSLFHDIWEPGETATGNRVWK